MEVMGLVSWGRGRVVFFLKMENLKKIYVIKNKIKKKTLKVDERQDELITTEGRTEETLHCKAQSPSP